MCARACVFEWVRAVECVIRVTHNVCVYVRARVGGVELNVFKKSRLKGSQTVLSLEVIE